jgi:hypothetical protein
MIESAAVAERAVRTKCDVVRERAVGCRMFGTKVSSEPQAQSVPSMSSEPYDKSAPKQVSDSPRGRRPRRDPLGERAGPPELNRSAERFDSSKQTETQEQNRVRRGELFN